jgi:hypothetical protein
MLDASANTSFRRIVAAAAFAVFTFGSVQAQTTTTPAPATAIPNVGQPEPPATQLAAARALVVESGMARSFAPMVPQLMEQIIPLLTRTRPELKANLIEVLKQLQPEFLKKEDDMINTAAHIYARRMSEQELKDAAAFFNSPVGKKYVEVQPAMLDELVVAMQSWTQELSTYMMTRVHQEMKAKGQDF